MQKLFIGTQNDGLFIIDGPPSPAGEGSGLVEWGPNAIAKFYKNDADTQAVAERIVAAFNATIEPPRLRCSECDNGVSADWPYCPYCGAQGRTEKAALAINPEWVRNAAKREADHEVGAGVISRDPAD